MQLFSWQETKKIQVFDTAILHAVFICMYACLYIYIYIYTRCVYLYVCMFIYIYIYIYITSVCNIAVSNTYVQHFSAVYYDK